MNMSLKHWRLMNFSSVDSKINIALDKLRLIHGKHSDMRLLSTKPGGHFSCGKFFRNKSNNIANRVY